jgi:hypothetical protein
MRHIISTLVLAAAIAAPAAAQVRVRPSGQGGVPPSYLPPPGACRVWYDHQPPGRQPAPINCRDAERIASRDGRARVIFGAPAARRSTAPYGTPYQGGYARPRTSYANVGFDRGYRDGYEKGREDARDRDSYDPVRHRWYRNGDRGYDRRFGPKEAYRYTYREGFEAGYEAAYREFGYRRGYRDDGAGLSFWFGWRR